MKIIATRHDIYNFGEFAESVFFNIYDWRHADNYWGFFSKLKSEGYVDNVIEL